MASKIADLNASLGLITNDFDRSIRRTERKLKRFAFNAQRIGSDLTQALSVPLAGVGVSAVKASADFERLELALKAVMSPAADVGAEIQKLKKIAEAPGLGFEQAVRASARLQAVGLSADQARDTIEAYANAVARSGGGAEEFDGTIRALTQIASKGKVFAEEINQINERVFEIRPALEAAFGTATSEDLQELGISAEEFISKTTKEFASLTKVQSGLANELENTGIAMRLFLKDIGDQIDGVLNLRKVFTGFRDFLDRVAGTFKQLDDGTKRQIVQTALFAAAVGPATLAIGKLTSGLIGLVRVYKSVVLNGAQLATGFISLLGGVNPLNIGVGKLVASFKALNLTQKVFATTVAGATIAIIALLVGKFINLKNQVAEVNDAYKSLAVVERQSQAEAQKEIAVVDQLIDKIEEGNISRQDQIKAIQSLQAKFPGFLDNLNAERVTLEDLKTARDQLNQSILQSARARAAEAKLTEVVAEELELREKQREAFQNLNRIRQEGIQFGILTEDQTAADLLTKSLGKANDGMEIQRNQLGELQRQYQQYSSVIQETSSNIGELVDIQQQLTNLVSENISTPIAQAPRPTRTPRTGIPQIETPSINVSDIGATAQGLGGGFVGALDQQVKTLATSFANVRLEATNYKTVLVDLSGVMDTIGTQTNALAQSAQQLGLRYNEVGKAVLDMSKIGTLAIGELSDGITQAIEGTKSFGQAIADAMKKAAQEIIRAAVAQVVFNALKGPLGITPIGFAAAAASGAVASAAFGKLINGVKLAQGGLAFGPTAAIVGDNPRAGIDPEVIAPLSKLREYISPKSSDLTITGYTIRGTDLQLILSRVDQQNQRIR